MHPVNECLFTTDLEKQNSRFKQLQLEQMPKILLQDDDVFFKAILIF